jgi:hypothetical protein
MTTETQPTTLSRDALETEYLTRLMLRDAKVWADRVEAGDRLTTRQPMRIGAIAIGRLAAKLGCPKGVMPAAFLLDAGWLTQTDDGGYVFTKKLCLPRGPRKKYRRKPRMRDTAATGAQSGAA